MHSLQLVYNGVHCLFVSSTSCLASRDVCSTCDQALAVCVCDTKWKMIVPLPFLLSHSVLFLDFGLNKLKENLTGRNKQRVQKNFRVPTIWRKRDKGDKLSVNSINFLSNLRPLLEFFSFKCFSSSYWVRPFSNFKSPFSYEIRLPNPDLFFLFSFEYITI